MKTTKNVSQAVMKPGTSRTGNNRGKNSSAVQSDHVTNIQVFRIVTSVLTCSVSFMYPYYIVFLRVFHIHSGS